MNDTGNRRSIHPRIHSFIISYKYISIFIRVAERGHQARGVSTLYAALSGSGGGVNTAVRDVLMTGSHQLLVPHRPNALVRTDFISRARASASNSASVGRCLPVQTADNGFNSHLRQLYAWEKMHRQ